jgi:hypothetical protein
MVEMASGNCLSDTHSSEILSQETQKIRFAKADPMHVRVLQTFSVGLKSSEYGCCGSKPAVPQHLCSSPVPVVNQSFSQAQINWLLPQMLNPSCMKNRPSLFDLPLYPRPRESVSHLPE